MYGMFNDVSSLRFMESIESVTYFDRYGIYSVKQACIREEKYYLVGKYYNHGMTNLEYMSKLKIQAPSSEDAYKFLLKDELKKQLEQ